MEPVKDKLLRERTQLEAKIDRLNKFRNSDWCKENIGELHKNLLQRQEWAMRLYSAILNDRIMELSSYPEAITNKKG